jgi:uncharacterized protein (TIGR02594 family)
MFKPTGPINNLKIADEEENAYFNLDGSKNQNYKPPGLEKEKSIPGSIQPLSPRRPGMRMQPSSRIFTDPQAFADYQAKSRFLQYGIQTGDQWDYAGTNQYSRMPRGQETSAKAISYGTNYTVPGNAPSVAPPQQSSTINPTKSKMNLGGPNKPQEKIITGHPFLTTPEKSEKIDEWTKKVQGIDKNQLAFIRGIGNTESGFRKSEATTDRYNKASNNANVRKYGWKGKDYGYYQTNQLDVDYLTRKLMKNENMSREEAMNISQHLHGGGKPGTSTVAQQTYAAHKLLQHRYPTQYKALTSGDPKAFEAARRKMSGYWFGLKDAPQKARAAWANRNKDLLEQFPEMAKELGTKELPENVRIGLGTEGQTQQKLATINQSSKMSLGGLMPNASNQKINEKKESTTSDDNSDFNNAVNVISAVASGQTDIRDKTIEKALSTLNMHERRNRTDLIKYLKGGGQNIDPARTAWCAAFVNATLKYQGIEGVTGNSKFIANKFLKWGVKKELNDLAKGDVLVQHRNKGYGRVGGHVGFATGEKRTHKGKLQLEMLGGNQSHKTTKKWVNASAVAIRSAPQMDSKTDENVNTNTFVASDYLNADRLRQVKESGSHMMGLGINQTNQQQTPQPVPAGPSVTTTALPAATPKKPIEAAPPGIGPVEKKEPVKTDLKPRVMEGTSLIKGKAVEVPKMEGTSYAGPSTQSEADTATERRMDQQEGKSDPQKSAPEAAPPGRGSSSKATTQPSSSATSHPYSSPESESSPSDSEAGRGSYSTRCWV